MGGMRVQAKQPNLTYVREGLDWVRDGLRPFIGGKLKGHYVANWWVRGVQSYVDPNLLRRIMGQTLHPLDEAALLKVFLGNWQPVFNYLDPIVRTYAREVLDIRNIADHWSTSNDWQQEMLIELSTRCDGCSNSSVRTRMRASARGCGSRWPGPRAAAW
jgi:hypothetical protein